MITLHGTYVGVAATWLILYTCMVSDFPKTSASIKQPVHLCVTCVFPPLIQISLILAQVLVSKAQSALLTSNPHAATLAKFWYYVNEALCDN